MPEPLHPAAQASYGEAAWLPLAGSARGGRLGELRTPVWNAGLLSPILKWVTDAGVDDVEVAVAATGGLDRVLARVAALTGLLLPGADHWTRIPVRAHQVADLYRSLLDHQQAGDLAAATALMQIAADGSPLDAGTALGLDTLPGLENPTLTVACRAFWPGRDTLLTHALVVAQGAVLAALTETAVNVSTEALYGPLRPSTGLPDGVVEQAEERVREWMLLAQQSAHNIR